MTPLRHSDALAWRTLRHLSGFDASARTQIPTQPIEFVSFAYFQMRGSGIAQEVARYFQHLNKQLYG